MNHKIGCVYRRIVFAFTMFAFVLTLGLAPAAQAAPGFTAYKDVQSEVQQGEAEQAEKNTHKVVLSAAAIVAALSAFQAAIMGLLAPAMSFITKIMNMNIVKGFTGMFKWMQSGQKQAEDLTGRAMSAQAGFQQEENNITTRATDHLVASNVRLEAAAQNAEMTANATGIAAASCPVVSQAARTEAGGLANNDSSAQTRARITFGSRGTPRADASGRMRTPTKADTVAVVANESTRQNAMAAVNAIGSQGDRGPVQSNVDTSQLHLKYFCTPGAFFGAMKEACGNTGNKNINKAGLDTRGADLLSGSTAETLRCFEDGIAGKTTLGANGIAVCPRNETWESVFAKQGVQPVISYDTGIMITNYMTPSPLPNFTPSFLKALASKNAGAAEVFTKRQAYSTSLSIAQGVFDMAVARRVPQGGLDPNAPGLSADQKKDVQANLDSWIKTYKMIRPTVPEAEITRYPSQMESREIEMEKFRNKEYLTSLTGNNPNAATLLAVLVQVQAQSLASQKDLLNSLERIELLLATQLSNDLRDRRDGLFRQVNDANNQIRQ